MTSSVNVGEGQGGDFVNREHYTEKYSARSNLTPCADLDVLDERGATRTWSLGASTHTSSVLLAVGVYAPERNQVSENLSATEDFYVVYIDACCLRSEIFV